MQTNIFGQVEMHGITIEQAAKIANVSTATIRNWIKTGYLIQLAKGIISQESLNKFIADVAGKEKLNARANKSLKDKHNHKELSDKLISLVKQYKGEEIGTQYENSLSESHRNKEGIYYTPSWIVRDMFRNIKINSDTTLLDPCCGSGNFLIEAIKQGVVPENVYGFDTDENAVLIAKQRIKDEFGYDTENIKATDFLQETIQLSAAGKSFDLIFTNPPWGKKIDKVTKKRYSNLYGCGNSLDTTALFLGASLSLLKPNGLLGFLIQDAFFNITAFEDIRKKILSKRILRFIDYGKAFEGLLNRAQAILIENKSANPDDLIECSFDGKVFHRTLKSFKENPKSIFNFWTTETEARVIHRLYSVPYITLKGKAKWALGIVTGNNNKFCVDKPKDGYIPIYKGSDITKNGLKEPTIFVCNDFSKFQQVAPMEMYFCKEKLIYRFISSDLCFFYDIEQRLILNSANLLIPLNIGISAEQLAMLLNSEIINWLFKKLFSTHKILRGDLEMLPIHVDYFSVEKEFNETNYLNYLQITKTEDGTYRVKE